MPQAFAVANLFSLPLRKPGAIRLTPAQQNLAFYALLRRGSSHTQRWVLVTGVACSLAFGPLIPDP
ncbi:hypothetical protein SBA5_400099 [Candidatus Sulfotelmatomonas gaucii]|uniref:Uncharacterized protein n=1 Tax=Candidatus Sulfuritelmatomonas gaucii TaxID=2043161 RepID=A0A2N9LKD1_9BACT|nr:hypothetical protein SBA5_400099 [Candidatus Sulfotelmatomonas gaucii]